MKKAVSFIAFVLLTFVVRCTSITGNGGSSSTVVACVNGTIISDSNTVQPGTQVSLIPADFNIITDTGKVTIYKCQSDTNGHYSFKNVKAGIYNLYAFHPIRFSKLLKTGIVIDSEIVNLLDNTLKQTSTIKIALPDTIDTNKGYVYIKGTTLSWSLKNAVKMSDNTYTVILDSVPSGTLPSLNYVSLQSKKTVVVINSITTNEKDTTKININSTAKPIWNIPLIVGITDQTVQYFGTIDTTKKLINKFISAVNVNLNRANAFNGKINIRIDSIYTFNTSGIAETNKACPDQFSLRLILDGFSSQPCGLWYYATRTAYEAPAVEQLFKQISIDAITWQFALGRGGMTSSYLLIAASKNSVNNMEFAGVQSRMYRPYTDTVWDAYNVNAINYFGTQKINKGASGIIGYPSSINIITKSSDGSNVGNTSVTLYGVKWQAYSVSPSDSIMSFKTNSSGLYTFTSNPFVPGKDGNSLYGNFLIKAISATDTAYSWMPIDEVGIAYFKNTPYKKIIKFTK